MHEVDEDLYTSQHHRKIEIDSGYVKLICRFENSSLYNLTMLNLLSLKVITDFREENKN